MGSEKRSYPRVRTEFELKIQHKETYHWTMLRNLSQGGVFVQTDAPLPVGSTVTMQLQLPVDSEPMEIQGRVMWTQQAAEKVAPGMGIQFTNITPEYRDKIIKFVGNTLELLGKNK